MGMCKDCGVVYSALIMKDGYCRDCKPVLFSKDELKPTLENQGIIINTNNEELKLEIERLRLENENLKLKNNNTNRNEEIELLRTIAKPMKSFEENKVEARKVIHTIIILGVICIVVSWILIFTWL